MKFPPATDIRKIRISLDITQTELSRRSGVSQSTIAKIERGKTDASYETVVNLFETLENIRVNAGGNFTAIDVCSKNVVSVQSTATIRDASNLMKSAGYSQLPVLTGDKPVGSLSEKNILEAISKGYTMEELSSMTVSRIMGDSFPVVSDMTPVNAIANLMSNCNAVLVSSMGSIVGMITNADLLKLI